MRGRKARGRTGKEEVWERGSEKRKGRSGEEEGGQEEEGEGKDGGRGKKRSLCTSIKEKSCSFSTKH